MNKIELPKLRRVDPDKPKKPKILLLSDDLRTHSGIATMSNEFVMGTCDKYDWVQLGAIINHPNHGQVHDLSADVALHTGVEDASVKVYAHNGYGNAAVLQEVLNMEKPDAILHFTDPRFWQWLYDIEHPIRQHIPIMYYCIWDDLPYPFWNEPYYESCDLIMNISRQTQNIVKNVIRENPKPHWAVQWVPHGVNRKKFYKIADDHPDWEAYSKWRDNFKKSNDVDFIFFWNNRNIRRKQPSDVILAFNEFCEGLPPEEASKCALFMHTQLVDPNGTDLLAVKNAVCPKYKVIFSTSPVDQRILNFYYNMADVTINIGSNEGFGISWCESLHAGTPIINNVTGGLQDGCRFEDKDGEWIEFTSEFPTNHNGTFLDCGDWAFPVFPSNRSLQGSPETPYIFDDRVDYKELTKAMKYWYTACPETRENAGQKGREWVLGTESNMSAKQMSARMAECIDTCLDNWIPRKRFELHRITPTPKVEHNGII